MSFVINVYLYLVNRIQDIGFKVTLTRWGVALVVLASLFSGYTSNTSTQVKHKTQTEWVASGRNFLARTLSVTLNKNSFWAHSQISFILFQNRLTQTAFIANLNQQKSFSQPPRFIQANYLPGTDEDLISA